MSADDTMAPIHQHTSDWQRWVHVCGRPLEIAWRYNGVIEFPMWRIPGGSGVRTCPHCCALLRADQEKPL